MYAEAFGCKGLMNVIIQYRILAYGDHHGGGGCVGDPHGQEHGAHHES
jgi:hypothetical protein